MILASHKNKTTETSSIRWIGTVCLFFALVFIFSGTAEAKKTAPTYAALVIDADTGLILHQENAGKPVYPASLTKMMTLLMVFDALDSGRMRLNDRVRISKHANSMEPSKLGLKIGASIAVEDAIYALVTKSANDIAVALAEKIGGNESNFAMMMTKKAQALGMRSTRFRNASGLHDARQFTTARDMTRLSLVLIKKYPHYYRYFSTSSFTYHGATYRNHNRLMETYRGMDGLKTGYIGASGFNLAASAVRNDRRLIGVVFGGKTAKSRNDRMARLLDDGFAKIGNLQVAELKKDVPVPQKKPIYVAGLGEVYPAPPKASMAAQPSSSNTIEQQPAPAWALLDTTNQNSIINRMIGQGDYDSAVRARIETGVIAIASVKGQTLPPSFFTATEDSKPLQQQAEPIRKFEHKLVNPSKFTTNQDNEWAIQIGAFSSRDSANRAISASLKRLPASLRNSTTLIAPLQTDNGWVFRGRLTGYTRGAALKACTLLQECLPIAPHAPQR